MQLEVLLSVWFLPPRTGMRKWKLDINITEGGTGSHCPTNYNYQMKDLPFQ
jgi:hypothetical protein